jgi:hypothetical protein
LATRMIICAPLRNPPSKSRLSSVDSTNSEVEEPGFGDGADLLDRSQD